MLKNLTTVTFLICMILFTLSLTTAHAQPDQRIHLGFDVLPGDDNTSARVQLTNKYEYGSRVSAGVGAGFTYYNDPLSLLPVFADLQYSLSRTAPAPFFFLRAGYNFSILTDTDTQVDSHRGGLMLNPGLGIRFGSGSGVSWYLRAGYGIDKSSFKQEVGNSRTAETDITYKRLTAGIGMLF